MTRRHMLRKRAAGKVSKLTGNEPTGIKALDRLRNWKDKRVEVKLRNGGKIMVAPGQYIKGVTALRRV